MSRPGVWGPTASGVCPIARPGTEPFEAQAYLYEQAERLASADVGVTFEPLSPPR